MDIDNDVPRMKRVSEKTNPNGRTCILVSEKIALDYSAFANRTDWRRASFYFNSFLVFALYRNDCVPGHSLGMHRLLIHHSYKCPKWLEYFFIHLGTVFGMAGPFGMMRAHDIRDWAQRHPACHDYLKHGSGFFKDGWWQLHCDLALDYLRNLLLKSRWRKTRYISSCKAHGCCNNCRGQSCFICWADGPGYRGISVRIPIQLTGHWLVGYFSHNFGTRDWEIEGAAVQGYNVDIAGLFTMGEAWHNNHHAFPVQPNLEFTKTSLILAGGS